MAEKTNDKSENGEEGIQVPSRFFMLLMLGFAVVIVGIILVTVASLLGGGSGSVGGVIFIGPFPIVFGAVPDAAWLITVSMAIFIVMIVIFVLMRRRNYRA
jgi:uncharacterized membrane protein